MLGFQASVLTSSASPDSQASGFVSSIFIYITVTSQQASACWIEIALRHYVMLIYTGLSSRAELVTDLDARDGTYLALEVDPATMAGSGGLRKSAST